ncbi:MAG: copper-binding protein [Pseudomonadota bacterium]
MSRFAVCLFVLAMSAGTAPAQEPQPAVAAAPLTHAEVVKVDKEGGKISFRHGAIQNLKMPAMTMAFKVADAAMLEQVKIGDKVAFFAEKVDGAFFVTRLEPAK